VRCAQPRPGVGRREELLVVLGARRVDSDFGWELKASSRRRNGTALDEYPPFYVRGGHVRYSGRRNLDY
jgi:hypothetical protein